MSPAWPGSFNKSIYMYWCSAFISWCPAASEQCCFQVVPGDWSPCQAWVNFTVSPDVTLCSMANCRHEAAEQINEVRRDSDAYDWNWWYFFLIYGGVTTRGPVLNSIKIIMNLQQRVMGEKRGGGKTINKFEFNLLNNLTVDSRRGGERRQQFITLAWSSPTCPSIHLPPSFLSTLKLV